MDRRLVRPLVTAMLVTMANAAPSLTNDIPAARRELLRDYSASLAEHRLGLVASLDDDGGDDPGGPSTPTYSRAMIYS